MEMYELCFSPTGGTQKVADILTGALADESVRVDLTDSKTNFSAIALTQADVAVIAVPSYGGRVPVTAVERLAAIQGNGARAVLACVYGNRAYEDTLVELQDTAKQAGFRVIGAVAAVAEHSIARQFAAGRPDEQDTRSLIEFAGQIHAKLSANDDAEPVVPGNRPYKKAGGASLVPKPTKACISCGVCAQACPVQAIHLDNPEEVDEKTCISCMRCISVCPRSARKVNSAMLAAVGLALKKVCSTRKDCELFL